MHQFEKARLRPCPAQLLDHTEADAAAAMHRDAGRLVQRQQLFVFVKDRELAGRRRCRTGAFGHPHGGHAHFVAERQSGIGAGPPAVDPHLAGADYAVDVGLRHALEQPQQEIVEPLPRTALVNIDTLHRCA